MASLLRKSSILLSRLMTTSSVVRLPVGIRAGHTVVQNDEKRLLTVKWQDGRSTQHPYTWLKDSCRCPSCAHPVSNNRVSLMSDLDTDCSPQSVGFDDNEGLLRIKWNDGHNSVFPYRWLAERCFSPEERKQRRDHCFGPPAIPWGKDHVIKQFQWDQVLSDKKTMFHFVKTIKEEGLSLVKDAPTDEGGLDKLIYEIAFPWACNYGVYFDVRNKGDPSNVSYTPAALNIHTDLPYYTVLPSIQFLHCMRKTDGIKGGENQITDGLYIAEDLRQNHPEEFKILCETVIQFWDYGTDFVKDFHYAGEQTTIRKDRFGRVCGIAFSNHLRDTFLNLAPEKVDDYFRALKLFDAKLYEHSITMTLEEGDIVVMDNHRVAHGRSSYTIATENDERHLRGTYIAWDEFSSRLRRLMHEFGR